MPLGSKVGYGVGGVLGLLLLILTGCYFGGVFDAPKAALQENRLESKPQDQGEDSGSLDPAVDTVQSIERFDKVLNSQDKITEVEEEILKKVQERSGVKVVVKSDVKPAFVHEGDAVKPAEIKDTQNNKPADSKTVETPVKSSPVMNLQVELPSEDSKKLTKENSPVEDPKQEAMENTLSAKDFKTPAKPEVKVPIPKWTPDATKLKPNQLGQLAFQFMSLTADLMTVKTQSDLKKATKKARQLVRLVFGDIKKFTKSNIAFLQAMSPNGAKTPKIPKMMLNFSIGKAIDDYMDQVLNYIRPQTVADFIPKFKGISRQIIAILYPVVVPFDSFSAMKIANEKSSVDAFNALHGIIFADNFEKEVFSAEAMDAVKTSIRSPEFIKALEKVYSEKDFALLVAADTSEEFMTILKMLMAKPNNYHLLPLLLSVLEEPSVRVTHKLLEKLFSSEEKVKKLFKSLKRVLNLIRNFKFEQDITKELIALRQESQTFQNDTELIEKVKNAFSAENFLKCFAEVYGEKEENWKLLPAVLQDPSKVKEKMNKTSNSFSSLQENGSVKRIYEFVNGFVNLGFSSTFFIQLILRLG